MWLEILVAKLATNFKDLVAKAKILVALAPVLGAILRPAVPILYGKQLNALYHSMSSHILLLGAIAMYVL